AAAATTVKITAAAAMVQRVLASARIGGDYTGRAYWRCHGFFHATRSNHRGPGRRRGAPPGPPWSVPPVDGPRPHPGPPQTIGLAVVLLEDRDARLLQGGEGDGPDRRRSARGSRLAGRPGSRARLFDGLRRRRVDSQRAQRPREPRRHRQELRREDPEGG